VSNLHSVHLLRKCKCNERYGQASEKVAAVPTTSDTVLKEFIPGVTKPRLASHMRLFDI
jgi:hypothetical protein